MVLTTTILTITVKMILTITTAAILTITALRQRKAHALVAILEGAQRKVPPALTKREDVIFIELVTSDRKLKASRKGSE